MCRCDGLLPLSGSAARFLGTVLGPQEVKVLAMGYVEEAVTSSKIPTIKETKDWGTYQIHGIKINKI